MLGGRIKPLRFRIMQTTSSPRSFMQGSNPSSALSSAQRPRFETGMACSSLTKRTLHFSTLLNRTSEVTNEALESIQQRIMIPELDAPPNTAEVDAAIKQLQTGKAPGPDGIPAEVFKVGAETLITHLTRMFQVFWVNSQPPQDLRDANIIHLYKNKGDRSPCDNHRGISLLNIAGKILARIMLNWITKHILDDVVSESQCGFRKQRARWIWSLLSGSSRKNVSSSTKTSTCSSSISPRHSTLWTELHSGRYSASLDAHLDLYISSAPSMMACFAGS